MQVYPFSTDNKNPLFTVFPFIFNGNLVEGISCGLSLRAAGDMKTDDKNRLVLLNKIGLNPLNVYALEQIHSRTVLAVDSANPPTAQADGMVTQDRNITLSVTVADCLPVFLFDAKSGAFGIVHSGWKGTGIAVNALALMRERYGTSSCDVAAILGPCIDSCCYKVDKERAEIFKKDFGGQSVRENGGYFLDLKAANIKLLKDSGVENIAVCNECTFCDERFGSFRREGERFTHMAAFVNC